MSKTLILLHGPNFQVLHLRNKDLYGGISLSDIENKVTKLASAKNLKTQAYQSNVEGEIVNFLNKLLSSVAKKEIQCAGLIVNLGAYTHTSIAIRDALDPFREQHVPIVEVHLSNILAREEFRRKSVVSDLADGVITGLGVLGYETATQWILQKESGT